mgnify:CR=1 FL=1
MCFDCTEREFHEPLRITKLYYQLLLRLHARPKRVDYTTGVFRERPTQQIFRDIERENLHDRNVGMTGGRAAAEEDAIRMLEQCALEVVAIADETRLEVAVVVLRQEIDHLGHQ